MMMEERCPQNNTLELIPCERQPLNNHARRHEQDRAAASPQEGAVGSFLRCESCAHGRLRFSLPALCRADLPGAEAPSESPVGCASHIPDRAGRSPAAAPTALLSF